MLRLGNLKVRKAGACSVALIEGDTQRLPLPSNTFGVVTVAFGLRNVSDTARGIDEMIRVARPGGKVAILEFSEPRGPLLGRLYLVFFRRILPRIGQAIAPNPENAYQYLPTSVLAVPRRPGDARPSGVAGPDRAPAVSADVRDRHALRRDQAASRAERMSPPPTSSWR